MPISENELEGLAEDAAQAYRSMHDRMGQEVTGNLAEEAPIDQGTLRGSFERRPMGPFETDVTSQVDYAIVASTGSRPHVIEPVNAQALAFEWQGAPAGFPRTDDGRVIMARVNHPGTQPTDYIPRAVQMAMERTQEFLDEAFDEVGL